MKIKLFITFFYIILISNLNALIKVDITRGNLDPLPIAISPLHVDLKSQDQGGIKVKNLGEKIMIFQYQIKNSNMREFYFQKEVYGEI